MRKSGLADSPLFAVPQMKKRDATPLSAQPRTESEKGSSPAGRERAKGQATIRDTMTPRNHETTASRFHETIIELIRKAVKEFGKEAATHRFTTEEKKAVADIIYSYKNRGIRTSENEIARIAVNFIINDHKENGEESVLDRALKALNG